jgi:hypothetical protein
VVAHGSTENRADPDGAAGISSTPKKDALTTAASSLAFTSEKRVFSSHPSIVKYGITKSKLTGFAAIVPPARKSARARAITNLFIVTLSSLE